MSVVEQEELQAPPQEMPDEIWFLVTEDGRFVEAYIAEDAMEGAGGYLAFTSEVDAANFAVFALEDHDIECEPVQP